MVVELFRAATKLSTSLKKALLPLVLSATGTWLLIGLHLHPNVWQVSRGSDASRQVGDARSKKPLRVLRATREDVVRLLGSPHFTSSSGRGLAYALEVQNGL